MKLALKISFFFLIALFVFISCDKEPVYPDSSGSGNPVVPANKPPIANAGTDVSLNYDLQLCDMIGAITLDGRSSSDSDGTITSYFWKGPGVITNNTSATAQVSDMPPGNYKFILSVGDDKGAIGTDTMVVNVVSLLNRSLTDAQLLPFQTLSLARTDITIASTGNKILFAGGYVPGSGTSTRVDIYDRGTNSWSVAELSVPRYCIATAVAGNKIFFAGGAEGGWWDGISTFANVDIYDASTNTWSVAFLSEARGWIAASAVGSKVFFAGGVAFNYINSAKVDIYDVANASWSIASLSTARSSLSAETVNNKIYFAGGSAGPYFYPSAVIDIYDNNTGSWSVSAMSEPNAGSQSIAVGNKIFWAGGSYPLNKVEVKDLNTQTSTFGCLFQPIGFDYGYRKALIKDNTIAFLPGYIQGKFDIYNISNDSWSIGILNYGLMDAAYISVNNSIYIAGGYVNGVLSNQVWKLEF